MTIKRKRKEAEAAFDYAAFGKEAIAGLTAGEDLIGENGVLTGMVGRPLSAALEPVWDLFAGGLRPLFHSDLSEKCSRRHHYAKIFRHHPIEKQPRRPSSKRSQTGS